MRDTLAVPGAPTEAGGDKPDGSRRPSVPALYRVVAGLYSGPFFMRGLLLMAVVVAFFTRKQWTVAIGHYRQALDQSWLWSRDLEIDSTVGPGVIRFELLWMAPFLSGGGYGAEATSFILPFSKTTDIRRVRIAQHGDGVSSEYYQGMPADQAKVLQQLAMARGDVRNSVVVCHSEPGAWEPPLFQTSRCPPAGYNGSLYVIGRTMFETDRVTPHHVARVNAMDEVWVPTEWAVQAFRASGVNPAKIVKVVEPVDVDFFSPTNRDGTRKTPLPLPQGRRILGPSYEVLERPYVFLSVFKWEVRKAWDVLVTAYLTEFTAADRTTLVMLTNPYHSDRNFGKKVAHLVASLGLQRPAPGWASVYILDEHVPQTALPHLYLAADAFVLPSRGEGWGRPHTEAMAMALPVITTNWSGPTEYLTEANSYPLPYAGLVEVTEGPFKGHRWAEPSGVDLQRLMRHVYDNREEAKAKGRQARLDMLAYAPQAVNRIVLRRLREIEAKLKGEGKLPSKERKKEKSGSSRKKEERMDL